MGKDKVARIGFFVDRQILSQGVERVNGYLSDKTNLYGRILLTLNDYLEIYFDTIYLQFTDEINRVLPNRTLTGIIGKVNRSEFDIGAELLVMTDGSVKRVDFSYPYRLNSVAFVIPKSKYKPEIFGVLKTLSLSVWISIIVFLMAISIMYYATMRRKYSLDKILLHSLTILFRQSSILRPSRMAENLLVYSWVVGAMFICLAYDSVFLSFLAFPPVDQIKNVEQLAKAVEKGEYHCVASTTSGTYGLLLKSEQENFKIIARDIQTNNLSTEETFKLFFRAEIGQNLALLLDKRVVDFVSVGNKFVSEDRFLESMAERKHFCCKKLLEKFVHRLTASGLYLKYSNDASFLIRLPRLLKYREVNASKRKLTLTDIAPAFLFLITGYVTSLLVCIIEIWSNRHKKGDVLGKKMKILPKDSL